MITALRATFPASPALDVLDVNTVYFEVNGLPAGPRPVKLTREDRSRMAYHHGQLRRALMDSALALLEASGPSEVTLRGVARRARVSPSAPYRHFADKETLLAAVATEGFEELARRLDAVTASVVEPLDRVLRLGVAYVVFGTEHRALYRLMFGPQIPERSEHPALDAAARRTFDNLAHAVAHAHDASLIGGDPREVTLLAWSVVHGFCSLVLDGQVEVDAPSVETVATRLGALLFEGVRTRRATRSA